MFIIKNKTVFLTISATIVLLSILTVCIFGLKLGIDFKGGALTEVNYPSSVPSVTEVQTAIAPDGLGEAIVQPTGTNGYIIKTRALSEAERTTLVTSLSVNSTYQVEEKSYNSIGPSVGKELARKSILSIILVAFAIILFIAFSFRKVSKPISSWTYGLIAIVTLIHDIAIPAGTFALLGHFHGAEVDTLFVVALLTVLGLSVSDTIVVFDRIRENLHNHVGNTFSETVGKSLSQTFTRSINTSLTVIIALLALYFFGPSTTKNFSLVLIVGMFFGTYSSIFVASPILVLVEQWQAKGKKK